MRTAHDDAGEGVALRTHRAPIHNVDEPIDDDFKELLRVDEPIDDDFQELLRGLPAALALNARVQARRKSSCTAEHEWVPPRESKAPWSDIMRHLEQKRRNSVGSGRPARSGSGGRVANHCGLLPDGQRIAPKRPNGLVSHGRAWVCQLLKLLHLEPRSGGGSSRGHR